MAKMERDAEREERITIEIVVDAYGLEEQVMGWYYYFYLQDTMQFPVTAICIMLEPQGCRRTRHF